MKLKISLILFFVFMLFANAQVIPNYGIKIGVITSKATDVSGEGYYSNLYQDSRLGGSFSVFARFLKSKYFRFEVDLGYKQVGAEDQIPFTTPENPDGTGQFLIVDHAYDILSLNIAMQPKYENKNICLFAVISPTLNYMIKNRDQTLLDDHINELIIGYNVGAGFQPKNILSGNIFIEVKFGGSFSEFIQSDNLEAEFNTWQFNIGSYIN